jgi:hypothetical protein
LEIDLSKKKISKDEWLINLVKETQKDPQCFMPELDARALMAEEFGIGEDWAYEVIRKIVKRYEQLVLEPVMIEFGDGKQHKCQQLRWVD